MDELHHRREHRPTQLLLLFRIGDGLVLSQDERKGIGGERSIERLGERKETVAGDAQTAHRRFLGGGLVFGIRFFGRRLDGAQNQFSQFRVIGFCQQVQFVNVGLELVRFSGVFILPPGQHGNKFCSASRIGRCAKLEKAVIGHPRNANC